MNKRSRKAHPDAEQKMPLHKVLFSSTGRIGRGTFLGILLPWFALTGIVFEIAEATLREEEKITSAAGPAGEIFLILVGVAFLFVTICLGWIHLAISIKRWHDRGRSGAMVLINLIPVVGAIWSLFELGFLRGTPGPNRYGAEPTGMTVSESCKRNAVFAIVAILVSIPFCMGKYFELKSPDPYDSGCYVYSAKHVLSGARIGYDEKPSAQAGTLLMNMLGVTLTGFNETGSKVLQGLFQAGAFTFLFITIRRLYGSLAAVLSVAVASVYLSAPLIAKYGNVKEQFMIAFMIMGICCFVWYHLTGKWWWALLTGTLLVWGPMFKQTGMSAIGAVGLFTLIQPILHHTGWKKAGKDVLLLVAGACITLAPILLWYVSMDTPVNYWPYAFILKPALSAVGVDVDKAPPAEAEQPTAQAKPEKEAPRSLIFKLLPGYVSNSWVALDPTARKQVFARILRYYGLLILPIALALGAIAARAVVVLRARRAKTAAASDQDMGKFVPLFGLWWFFDMAFVWISPHTYEQYFLPLNASGAVLGGYLAGLYAHRLQTDRDKTRWVVLGLLGSLAVLILSWHIFFGIKKSPHSGGLYPEPTPRRGYVQKWGEVRDGTGHAWTPVGRYIRDHSEPADKIYVWGWIPGIYVQAQRMSSAPKAFEGTMHTLPPQDLAERARELLDAFEREPPKFIVDTQNQHFPWDRPPLPLWPRTKEGFLPANEAVVKQFDQMYAKALSEQIEPAEARRYEVLKPLRSYVMNNYQVANQFGPYILFKRK